LELARAAAELVRGAGAWFAVHDRAHLAATLGADAVHLSFRSLGPGDFAAWPAPRTFALGLSTHAGDDPAGFAGADYLFHGPLHATPSKAGLLDPVGLDGLARAVQSADRPLLAIGGVTPLDVPALRARGVHGVAVRAGILGATDPARATEAYLRALDGAVRAAE